MDTVFLHSAVNFDLDFLAGFFSVILVDLVLAGDNAVVFAVVLRSLPRERRKKGIIFGAAAAVASRVILTFFVSQVLHIHYLKLAGGIWITWAAIKLFSAEWAENVPDKEAAGLSQIVKLIVITDITMSLDNMLAVAGASQNNLLVLLCGLGLSIPFVVLTSNLLSILMDKYPVIIYIGSAVLGKVGAEMIMTDEFIVHLIHPGRGMIYSAEIVFAAGVIAAGRLLMKRKIARQEKEEHIHENRAH